ncbi:hypothetical protein ACK32R_21325 [Aeromonas dhakensis]|uniref:hypothetical protein n=1 Tax=Aeromonas dhakensis TaxID=196024 RepID=UPI003987DE96
MQLSPCQKSHVDTVFPECRQRIAEYLVRGAEVVVFRQTECGSDVPPFAVAPVDDIEFWIGCWDSYELAVESALALGLQVQLAPQWFDVSTPPEKDGDYQCKIANNGRVFTAKRRFKKGHWFGGCRPFADADVILEWSVYPV